MTRSSPSDAAPAPAEALAELLDTSQSLVMAFVDEAGRPHVSHLPFAWIDSGFFVWVSSLAEHSGPLRRGSPVEVMILADEARTPQVYARRRASWQCSVHAVTDAAVVEAGLDALRARHGEVVSLLAGLSDFRGFRLEPGEGRLVLGFAQAYSLAGLSVESGPITGR
ncbi:MAG: pyridoxamine 5'-phosphate oxidase family protein [Halothiobacillaceae bacterium]